jgi:hypothetical protein
MEMLIFIFVILCIISTIVYKKSRARPTHKSVIFRIWFPDPTYYYTTDIAEPTGRVWKLGKLVIKNDVRYWFNAQQAHECSVINDDTRINERQLRHAISLVDPITQKAMRKASGIKELMLEGG